MTARSPWPPSPEPSTSSAAQPPAPELVLPVGVVRQSPILAALKSEQLQELLRHASKRRFQRGAWILRQGERNHHLHLLLSGRAHMLRSDAADKEVILELVRPGEHFGEMALIDNLPCSRSVRCAQTSDVLLIEGHAVAKILPLRPELSAVLTRTLAGRLRRARRQIASLALYDVEGRMLRLLLDLAEEQVDGRLLLRERLSRQELARMVGASREMVSRIMVELELRGVLNPAPDGGFWVQASKD